MDDAAGDAIGAAEQRSACSMSPASRASRTAELDTRSPSCIQGVHRLDAEAVLRPAVAAAWRNRRRALAEAEVVADRSGGARPARATMRSTNCSAVSAAKLVVEATDMAAVDPAFGQQLELVAQAGQTRRRLTAARTTRADAARRSAPPPAGRPVSRALVNSASSARWPRCTPSKLPMVSTVERRGPLGNTAENQHGVK
jgi:hypothetical protein